MGRALTRRGRRRCCAPWRPVLRGGCRRRALPGWEGGVCWREPGCCGGEAVTRRLPCPSGPTLVFGLFETRSRCVTQVSLEGTVALRNSRPRSRPSFPMLTLQFALGQAWEFVLLAFASNSSSCLHLPRTGITTSHQAWVGYLFICTTFKGINFKKKCSVYVLEEGRAMARM